MEMWSWIASKMKYVWYEIYKHVTNEMPGAVTFSFSSQLPSFL